MKTFAFTRLFVALCAAFTLRSVCAETLPLSQAQLKANYHATAKMEDNGAILLRFRSPEWSAGVSVLPPAGSAHWDFSQAKYLAVDVENLSTDHQMRLTMHISSGSRNQNKDTSGLNHTNNTAVAVKKFRSCNTGIGLNPGEKRTMKIELPHSAIYGHPESFGRRVLDTDAINSVDFEMQWPFEAPADGLVNCRLSNLRLEGDAPLDARIPEEHYLPFVDKFGQYNHSEWPEKIHSAEELQSVHQQEVASLKPAPATWDRFGGWANGPKLEATGAFRVEKVDGRWWLVTPDGTLFWSTGLDVVQRHSDPSNVRRHPTWYDAKPDGDGSVRFTERNLIMKYGKKKYEADFDAMLFKRLRSWGINTIGA